MWHVWNNTVRQRGKVMKRNEVYELIDGERDYQDQVWAENAIENNNPLRVGEDLALIEVYLRKAFDTWSTERRPEIETMGIIRKIAGICVRSMETNCAPPRTLPQRRGLGANAPRLPMIEVTNTDKTD